VILKKNQMKKIYIVGALFLCLGAKAQTMYVRPVAGSQTTYPVADIQKLTFDNGNMLVTNITGANGTFALSSLRYVSFTEFNLGTTNPDSTNPYLAYPNPARDLLTISGISNRQRLENVQILSLEGRLLQQQKPATESTQVDISGLPQGMYLCKITNGNQHQIIKFLKQ
jgi:hypothetical protein